VKASAVDTNVIIRFLVEDPEHVDAKFREVFGFFSKVEKGEVRVYLPALVVFQAFFVLTSYYEVPVPEAATQLKEMVSLKGFILPERDVLQRCFSILIEKEMDLVDAYLLAWSKDQNVNTVYSFDKGLAKKGLKLLPVR